MKDQVETILGIIKSKRLSLNTEKELQKELEQLFDEKGLEGIEREYAFDKNNIVDFFWDGLAIEVKIKGSKPAIYKQCERYCEQEEVKSLLLITNRTMGFPEQINKKDCYAYSIGQNWL